MYAFANLNKDFYKGSFKTNAHVYLLYKATYVWIDYV